MLADLLPMCFPLPLGLQVPGDEPMGGEVDDVRRSMRCCRQIERPTVMRNTLIALWSGDLPLGQAFWHYAIAYGTIANILATAAAIAALLAGLPDAVAIGLHFLPLPYVVIAVVGVWRSADKYRGDPTWAGIAKAAVIVWGALMVFV
jgi:hypothetical protein